MKLSKNFEISNINDNFNIIYPAGKMGKIIYNMLNLLGVKVKYFCDQNLKGTYCGIPIISPIELKELYSDSNIVISSLGHYFEIMSNLNDNSIENVYDVTNLINIEDIKLKFEVIKNDEDFNIVKTYKDVIEFYKNNKLMLPSLDLVVTEKCSLRCKNCSNLMQYYEDPKNYSIDQITIPLNNLLNYVEEIRELRLIGGEPFMNKELYKLINLYKDNSKIKELVIYTNGTIQISEENLKSLKNTKVKLYITDYDKNHMNVNKVVNQLNSANIKYYLNKSTEWKEFPELKRRDLSNEKLKELYKECCCKTIFTLIKGKLFRCPFLANATNLQAIPNNCDEYVECSENIYNENEFKKRLKKILFDIEYFEGCAYCGGRNWGERNIEPAIQVEKPLKYIKCI